MTLTKTSTTLKERVNLLIKEVDTTHRYSMSRIYGLYNEVFSQEEIPQSCASCLIRKVTQLRAWLQQSEEKPEAITKKPKKSLKTSK